jgi:hypothetical protein
VEGFYSETHSAINETSVSTYSNLGARRIRGRTEVLPSRSVSWLEEPNRRKIKKTLGHWWLTPEILATKEAKIGRITLFKASLRK